MKNKGRGRTATTHLLCPCQTWEGEDCKQPCLNPRGLMVHVASTHVAQVINGAGAICFNAIGRAICSGCKYLRSTTGKQCSRCGTTKM
eukprot:5368366-Heterocapsa_arctica.AAC.1